MAKENSPKNASQPTGAGRLELPPGVKLACTLQGHTSWIGRIAWSLNGWMLASPSNDQSIRLWDVGAGACIRILKGHNQSIYSVAFNPAGNTLASASGDKTVKLW